MQPKILLLLCCACLTATALADPSYVAPPENLISIQPHTRSTVLNAKHADYCVEMGGVDITDSNIVEINDVGTADVFACKIVNHNKYKTYLQTQKENHSVGSVSKSSLNNSLATLPISATAPGGFFMQTPFIIEGSGDFNGVEPFSYKGKLLVKAGSTCSATVFVNNIKDETIVARATCTSYPHCPSYITSTTACYTDANGQNCNAMGTATSSGPLYFKDSSIVDPTRNQGFPDNPPSCNMPSPFVADPINIAIGNSFQQEIDITGRLSFIRYYNSLDGVWRNNYSSNTTSLKPSNKYPDTLELTLTDGRIIDFFNIGSIPTPMSIELGTLKRTESGYEYTSPFHEVSDFDAAGRLTRTVINGIVHNFSYPNDRTIMISDSLNNTLTILENAEHQPIEVKNSFGKVVTYAYDAEKRLIKVTKNHKSRMYHYEDARFPTALTGITNERGIKYVNWTYDDQGRANSNFRAGNKDKVTITYNSDTQSTVTNPLGRKYTYNYKTIDGLKRITSISGAASSLCPAIGSSYQYNTRGLVTQIIDGRGIKTTYEYNSSGKESSRTIADGKSNAVTVKTQWAPLYDMYKVETYPDKTVIYNYDKTGSINSITSRPIGN